MQFIDNRKVLFREVEVGDIVVCRNARYMIVQDVADDYRFVNLDSGMCSGKFRHISEIMKTFNEEAQFLPNCNFKLILE